MWWSREWDMVSDELWSRVERVMWSSTETFQMWSFIQQLVLSTDNTAAVLPPSGQNIYNIAQISRGRFRSQRVGVCVCVCV